MSFLSIKITIFKILLLKKKSSIPVIEDSLKKYIINRRVKP